MSTKATTREEAETALSAADSNLRSKGYRLERDEWTPGAWSGGDFFLALLACLLLVGILIFIYMAVVKPKGTMNRTYVKGSVQLDDPAVPKTTKTCPQCAEEVKVAATICRFCRYGFPVVEQEVVTRNGRCPTCNLPTLQMPRPPFERYCHTCQTEFPS